VIAVLAGGVGAARLATTLLAAPHCPPLRLIVNVGDDEILHGLNVSPDLDTITYTLAGAIDPQRGWGLVDESWRAIEMVRSYASASGHTDIGWFGLGDHDLGTHLYRTSRLASGATLSEVTAEIAARWQLTARLLPVTNDRVATVLETPDGAQLTFQEYFVQRQHNVEVDTVRFLGAESARPAPEVLDTIALADSIIIAPSNPLISIAPVLAIPGVREAITERRADVTAVSPIIGGKALKGPADRLLTELGHEPTALGVARIYADLASTMVIDTVDQALIPEIEALGMDCIACGTVMSDPSQAAELAAALVPQSQS
jgi:LPPG:FO 2-phospho-L-lactate transferase